MGVVMRGIGRGGGYKGVFGEVWDGGGGIWGSLGWGEGSFVGGDGLEGGRRVSGPKDKPTTGRGCFPEGWGG